ncbi:hypothetical protein [Haloparvum sp. AD34]
MTEERDRGADDRSDADQSEDRPTMGDVSHTNPYTNETFGGIYRRGPAVADGGAAPKVVDGEDGTSAAVDASDSATDSTQTMGEIDHTPRDLNVNNVWDRGDSGFVPGDD